MSIRETKLQVRGMTCGSCVRHVDHALKAVPGVTAVEVSLTDGVASVLHDEAVASVDELRHAVTGAGYEAA